MPHGEIWAGSEAGRIGICRELHERYWAIFIGHRRPLLPWILDKPFLISLIPRASGQSRRNGVKGASPSISPARKFVKELCCRVPLSWSSLQEEKLSHAGCTRSAFSSLCLRGRPLDVLRAEETCAPLKRALRVVGLPAWHGPDFFGGCGQWGKKGEKSQFRIIPSPGAFAKRAELVGKLPSPIAHPVPGPILIGK
jgi:hypothetical protein